LTGCVQQKQGSKSDGSNVVEQRLPSMQVAVQPGFGLPL
jgi:hypothetical protein